jgi:hypothetical protein
MSVKCLWHWYLLSKSFNPLAQIFGLVSMLQHFFFFFTWRWSTVNQVFVPDKFVCEPNICKHDQEPSGVTVKLQILRAWKNLPWAFFFEAAKRLVTLTPSPSVNVCHNTFIFITDAAGREARIFICPRQIFCWSDRAGSYRRGRLSTVDPLVLTSLDQPLLILKMSLFYKASYLNNEVNRTEPSPSVSVPWSYP